MNADFDGDQAAVHLPLGEAAQKEAGEKLSLAGHLARDPDVLDLAFPGMDAVYGLATLGLTAGGRKAVTETAGREVLLEDGIVTREAVVRTLRTVLDGEGATAALEAADRLIRLGFRAARADGGSIGPFLGSTIDIPEPPCDDDLDQWLAYQEEIHAIVAGFRDYGDEDLGPAVLMSHCGARGSIHQVAQLFSPQGPVHDARGEIVQVRGCWRDGLASHEVLTRVVGARNGLFRMHDEFSNLGRGQEARERPEGHGVLARARRAQNPGVVLARAAAAGEVDPLEDRYARLFVGIQASEEVDLRGPRA